MSSPDPLPVAADPARRPRTLGQRLQLLCVLLLLPAAAVSIPTLITTHFLGQASGRWSLLGFWQAKHATPTPAPDLSGLKDALNHSAEAIFPTPAPLSPDTIVLKVRAEHVDARVKKVAGQAQGLGGAAVPGVVATGERAHLYVDLPAGRAEAFREAVTKNEQPVAPAATPAPGSTRDQLEVVIRAADDDE